MQRCMTPLGTAECQHYRIRISRTHTLIQSDSAHGVHIQFVQAHHKRDSCLICILHMYQSHNAIVAQQLDRRGNGSSVDESMLYVSISLLSITRSDLGRPKPNPTGDPTIYQPRVATNLFSL